MKYKKSNPLNKQYYFAYGANMAISSMKNRCPLAEPVGKMILRGWRLDFSHHATIIKDSKSVCEGVLWKITEYCERNLDIFEGYPSYYTKLYLEQDSLPFMVYEMVDPDYEHYPSSSYIDCLREGYNDWKLDHGLLDRALGSQSVWEY